MDDTDDMAMRVGLEMAGPVIVAGLAVEFLDEDEVLRTMASVVGGAKA